jgi:hypothetical protein
VLLAICPTSPWCRGEVVGNRSTLARRSQKWSISTFEREELRGARSRMDGEDADLAKVWRDDRWLMSNDLDEKSVLVYFKLSDWSSRLNTSPRPWLPHIVLRARMPPELVASDHAGAPLCRSDRCILIGRL